MAINKNFVVKNGLEVNTSLIVADSENSRVGVATTTPAYQFHVFGGIGVTNLTVTGLSTFSGISTFQDGVFIGGISTHIGVGTFQNDVFIEGQLFNSDTTENTLGDVDSGSVQLSGGLGVAKNTTIGAGLSVLDGLTVVGLSTFVGIVTTSSDLFVGGDLFISEDLVLDTNLNILGIATIGRLHVTGIGTIDGDARVGGALTVTSSVDFNDDLDVDGRTELDITNISETLNVTGISTFASAVDINDDLDVDGRTELDVTNIAETLNVTGVSTFASTVDINSDLDVDGRTELDITNIAETLNVTGVSTFASTVDINSDLDVDGRTELDITNIAETLNVTGISTFASDVDINASVDIQDDLVVNDALNVTGISTFASDVDINASVDIQDDLVVNGALNVTGVSTFASTVDINSDLDVDGRTELDITNIAETLNVTGVSTFASDVDINSDLDVDGRTELDDVNVSEGLSVTGVGTFLSNLNVGAALTAASVVVGSAVTVDSSGIDVVGIVTTTDGYTVGGTSVINSSRELQNIASLDATTTATIESAIANAPNTFTDLKVTGITTLGIASATDFTADNVNVSLATTTNILAVTGIATAETLQVGNLGLSVTGVTTQTGDLIVGVSTFFVDVSTGRVGIGTDNPGSKLHIISNNNVPLRVQSPTADSYINFVNSQNTNGYIGYETQALTFYTNNTEKLRITSGGDVGIATTTPQTSLHLLNADPVIRLQDENAANNIFAEIDANSTAGSLFLDLDKNNAGADTQFGVSLDGSGKLRLKDVGLGVLNTSPTSALDVTGDARISGVVTAIGGYNLGIHSAGTEVTTAVGVITALDFVGTGNSICFKNQDTTTKVIEINIAGSGGGGGGGVTEVDTNVSSTSATGVGSFAVASFRSAAVIAQIDQTGDYQVGRYLMIHDGTTVTVIEESAVSTGATMLGSFSGAIVGSNAELQVTMGNAGIATVTTKIDTVTV